MSDADARAERMLDLLYAAAETLLDAVTDPAAVEAAPMRDRTAAFNVVQRFIDCLERRAAARAKAAADAAAADDRRRDSDRRSALTENMRTLSAIREGLDDAIAVKTAVQTPKRRTS
jgi:hypothetical protein